MINRDTRLARSRAVAVVVFTEALHPREKRLSFHGNAVTLWHLSTLMPTRGATRRSSGEAQNTLSALYYDANANRAGYF